ncbi:MAG: hypothetical protein E7350_04010 [Clostridiales bacterium]|nr:hypothetical protein [Clostridiales bacterium]
MKRLRLKVSPLVIVMLILLIAFGHFYDCAVYLTTIVLHELAHAEMATRLGYTLDSFVLMPYGASLCGDFECVRSKDEILIALAGPLCNIIIAVVTVAVWWIFPASYVFTDRVVFANLFTAAFNLLPVFPLDGGRVALAAFSVFMPRQRAYRRVRIFGYIASPLFAGLFVLAIVLGVTVNFSFALISVFIFVSTAVPDKSSTYRRVYDMAYFSERLGRGLKVSQILVPDTLTLIQLDRMLSGNCYTCFTVVNESLKTVASITETELMELLKNHSPLTTIKEIGKKQKNQSP